MEFRRTIGHQKQKDLFRRAVQNGRLVHAYALAGPAHVGKTTFALDLAEGLGAHEILDVALFDSGEGLKVLEARALQSRLSLTPTGKWKVAIITAAESMNAAAANSLLKILEEPPPKSLIILVAGNFYALLPTVASRVQRINFAVSSAQEVAEGLREFALTGERQEQIMRWSAGRIGLARTLAQDDGLYEFYGKAGSYYESLCGGTTLRRLTTAQALQDFSDAEARQFLDFAMRLRAREDDSALHPGKLLRAREDLRSNLNWKLILDNLFLQ